MSNLLDFEEEASKEALQQNEEDKIQEFLCEMVFEEAIKQLTFNNASVINNNKTILIRIGSEKS